MKSYRYLCILCVLTFCFVHVLAFQLPLSASAETSSSEVELSAFPEEVGVLVNTFRAENGLEPLKMAPILQQASQLRAAEQQQTYGHSRPDGTSWSTVIAEVGLDDNCYAAENVAAGYDTPESVVDGWKNSASHRAAMLGEYYQYIGIGVSYLSDDANHYHYYWELLLLSADPSPEGAWLPGSAALTNVTGTAQAETTVTTTTTRYLEGRTRMGDINMDNEVSLADAVLLQQITLGQVVANTVQLQQADCCSDGVVDQRDAMMILRYCMQLVLTLDG